MTLPLITFLNEAATAERLGVSQRSLQRWRRLGTGPAYTRIGSRRIAYRDVDIDEWIAGRVYESRAAELAAELTAGKRR